MEKILKILQEIRPDVNFETSRGFVDEQILDSLDVIRLVSDLEIHFNISVDVSDIVPENFNTMESISALVSRSRTKR